MSLFWKAGFIAEILTLAALQAGKNVLVDGSLRDAEWYKIYFQRLRQDFPSVRQAIIHVTAPRDAVFQRAAVRSILFCSSKSDFYLILLHFFAVASPFDGKNCASRSIRSRIGPSSKIHKDISTTGGLLRGDQQSRKSHWRWTRQASWLELGRFPKSMASVSINFHYALFRIQNVVWPFMFPCVHRTVAYVPNRRKILDKAREKIKRSRSFDQQELAFD